MAKIVRKILNPPKGETGLHQVRENLGRLVNETRWQIPPVVTDLLVELDGMAAKEIRGADWSVKYSVPASSRLHGTLVDHPVWAALYADNRRSTIVRQLQSLLLEALADSDGVLLPHDVAAAGLLIRVLSLGTGEDDQYYDDLLEAVAQCPATASQKTNAGRFIRAALGQRVTRRERGSVSDVTRAIDRRTGTRRDAFGEIHVLVPSDPDDPVDLPEVGEFVPTISGRSGSTNNRSLAGIEVGEDYPGDQILLLLERVRALSVEKKLARRQSQTARDILARANAALPITYQQLTDTELRKLARYISDVDLAKNPDIRGVQMALRLMLYTSSSLDDVLSMADQGVAQGLSYDSVLNRFRIPRIQPDYRTSDHGVKNLITNSTFSENSYVSTPNFYIRPESIAGFYLWLKSVKKNEFSNLLKKEISNISNRITLSKIQRSAFEIAKANFDPVIVQTTFGLRVPSANVQQYYSSISDEQVIQCYTSATTELRRRMGMTDKTANSIIYGDAHSFYSPRNMPTDQCVIKMLNNISMEAACSVRGSPRWHNSNTLLCVMVQAIFTTIRGVYDPIVSVDNDGYALFYRDKDKEDFSHSRFQFIHPMSVLVSDCFRSVRSHTLRYKNIETINHEIFLLDEDGGIIQPRPKIIREFLVGVWPYPLNSLRKFVRRKMLESGVSYESTNMVMNHHSVGEASWDRYSVDDPIEMRLEVIGFYDRVIRELGICDEWFHAF
ncbi:hypothetical protein [Thalassolituus sp. UBA2009]|jgi:hypothetical protein|uniref:hypothetical protein n=1 Tax=Thalassolituus sp. UBA2009 TaxID=1947658 RepID=UPI000C576143|nr:hypothetical protein [Thalassolituus sp. UBA2009]MAY14323.1 hypothetical protein [Oceanospirillaceae bacterium]